MYLPVYIEKGEAPKDDLVVKSDEVGVGMLDL